MGNLKNFVKFSETKHDLTSAARLDGWISNACRIVERDAC